MTESVRVPLLRKTGESAEGVFIIDDERDLIQKRIRSSGDFYERSLLDFVAALSGPRPIFIDVGANIGNHSVYMGVALGATVIAFEPNQANFQRLCRNMRASGLDGAFHPFNAAVGDVPGFVKSVVGRQSQNTGGAKVAPATQGEAAAVPIVMLDAALEPFDLGQARDVLVKIDVEGMEVEVLGGMRDLIARRRPLIICEISTDRNIVRVANLLKPAGYVVLASFFKSPTFVLVPQERVSVAIEALCEASWSGARAYVEYCRQRTVLVHAQRQLREMQVLLEGQIPEPK